MERLKEIFKIISFFDDCRWQKKGNYYLINFYSSNLNDDEKILIHWLCYIMDRQMQFEIIWDVGGFVVSELVHEIISNKDISLLSPNNVKSFLKKDNKDKFYLLGKTIVNSIIQDNYSNNIEKNLAKFKSRFFPSDYMCILSTFVILHDFNFSLAEYIGMVFKKNKEKNEIIIRIAFSLYILTYYDIGKLDTDDIKNYNSCLKKSKERKNSVLMILNNEIFFEKEFIKFKNDIMFKQKRTWCSFRDFIKSKEFNIYFRNSISKYISIEDINLMEEKRSLIQFVLPGDVWNNNSKFRKCILRNTLYKNSNDSLNKILKIYFDNNKIIFGYPEQFDITFDFVPRMCDKNNCDICPIENIDKKNNFLKICNKNTNKYCSVALIACNYKCACEINCKLL